MRIDITKEAFNRKMSLLTNKLNIEFKEIVYSIVLYGSWTKKIGAEVFGEL